MEQLADLLIKGAGVVGSLVMAAFLRYLEKTSIIKHFRQKISDLKKD